MRVILSTAASMLGLGCGGADFVRPIRVCMHPEDGGSVGPELVFAIDCDGRPREELLSDLEPSRLSLVRWPGLEVVPSRVERTSETLRLSYSVAPTSPLAAGWYAVRWVPAETPGVEIEGGIPLRDGSHVFRLYGQETPELARAVIIPDELAPESSVVVLELSHAVVHGWYID